MLIFTILVFFCLLSAFITFGLGVFVFAKNPSSPANRLFIVAMLAATYWALGEFLIWHTGGYENVWLWLKYSSFWPFVIAFTVHFVLTFTGHPLSTYRNKWCMAIALYLPAAIISMLGVLSDTIYTVLYREGIGYTYLPVQGSPVYLAETIYILSMMLWAAYVSITSWRAALDESIRKQSFLVSIGLVTIIVCGVLSGILLPVFGIFTPNMVFIGIVIFTLLITYAILTCGLFILSPETAVPDILRTMPDGMVLLDTDGRVIAVNAAASEIFAMEEQNLRGREIASLLPEKEYKSIWRTILEQGQVSDMEAAISQEPYRVGSIAGALVRDPTGNPAGSVLVIRDITSRKESEKALRIANEKISLLTELTLHDISNLISALSAYLELMREGIAGPAHDAYLSSSSQVVEKITRHLRFAREYQEFGSSQPAWQNLGNMVAHAVDDIQHEGIGVMLRIDPIEIFADPLAVRVISNMLDNAIRHGEKVTRIRVWTEERPGKKMVLIFEDDGVGIRDEEKEYIFRYGFGKHTGLGLAISRDILSITGITIRETGKANEGARFEICIPPQAWRRLE
ncbi:MAG: PAS domain S-box protein [Methanolinea sp.]|jgi:PAS domain S-box-containing protein|nr:PAS domain S-box protein [Methanolinea sp.]